MAQLPRLWPEDTGNETDGMSRVRLRRVLVHAALERRRSSGWTLGVGNLGRLIRPSGAIWCSTMHGGDPHPSGPIPLQTDGQGSSQVAGPETSLDDVRRLVAHGRHAEVIALFSRVRKPPAWLRNAFGVCLLRSGNVYAALGVFNELALLPGSLSIAAEASVDLQINLATARLMARNVKGCLRVLTRIDAESSPYVGQLLGAIRAWDRGQSFKERVLWRLGCLPKRPICLNFEPGIISVDV